MPHHALNHCAICQRQTPNGPVYDGLHYSAPIEDFDGETISPGHTTVTLDMPHAAYETLHEPDAALRSLTAEVEASGHFQGMKRLSQMGIGMDLQWTAAGLAQAVLDQQVLRRAFDEELQRDFEEKRRAGADHLLLRKVQFAENWPETSLRKGSPERHVHTVFKIEGEPITKEQVDQVIRHAVADYDRLSHDVPANGFSTSGFQTKVGRSLKFGGTPGR